jgi:hypothetical protein
MTQSIQNSLQGKWFLSSMVLKPGWHTYDILIPPYYYNAKPDRIFECLKPLAK